jgi:ribonuclease HII
MAIFGIDEAGRGPVLGSMFISVVKIESESELLGDIKDSKNLSYKKIHSLAAENESIERSILEVTPSEIDSGNITSLAISKMGEGLRNLGVTVDDEVYADACLPDEESFEEQLAESAGLDSSENIIGEHGADDTYPVVGMASIFAKSSREKHVDSIQAGEERDIGSGYPSDPNTRSFLEEYIKETGVVPEYARKSWSTCEDLLEEYGDRKLDEF